MAEERDLPLYILRLDDLPAVVEANGRVWPVLMSLLDAARLFNMTLGTFKEFVAAEEFLVYMPRGEMFIEVAEIHNWIRSNGRYLPEKPR